MTLCPLFGNQKIPIGRRPLRYTSLWSVRSWVDILLRPDGDEMPEMPGWGGGYENTMNKSRLRKPLVYRWGVVVV